MPKKIRSRKQSKLYNKTSKAWRDFAKAELQTNTSVNNQSVEKSKITGIKFKLPNKYLLTGILVGIALFMYLSCYIKNSKVPRYSLTVNVVTNDSETLLNDNIVKIVKDGKTVASYSLDENNMANINIREGEYSIEMDGDYKGSIKVKMNMDRNVELKVNKVTN